MPNVGHRWTEEEERASLEMDFDEFTSRFPGITRDAYRIRRQTLRREQAQPTECWLCRLLSRLHSHG